MRARLDSSERRRLGPSEDVFFSLSSLQGKRTFATVVFSRLIFPDVLDSV